MNKRKISVLLILILSMQFGLDVRGVGKAPQEGNEQEAGIIVTASLVDISRAKGSEEIEEPVRKEETKASRIQWNLTAANAEAYVKDVAAGEKVKVAVLDTGVNCCSEIEVKECVTMIEDMESDFLMFEDATGHGTAVASLINGVAGKDSIQGLNEDAEIYSVQVLGSSNTGKLSSVVKGIYWAIDNDMDIINMSFGIDADSDILYKAVCDASRAGILMVAAAGNGGKAQVQYPAAYEEVMAVGAVNMAGEIAVDSARGSQVDIYAPGERILADSPMFGTIEMSGTSIACAQVTAAASMILEKENSKGADFVRGLLEDTANIKIDLENDKGMLDVKAAMDRYISYVPGVRTETGEMNNKPLAVFAQDEVKALWNGAGHQETIINGVNGYKLMYASSTYPDKSGILHDNRRFHGSKNYKVTLEFLVNLAYAYYNKNDTLVNSIYNNANSSLKSVEADGNGTSYGCSTVDGVKWYLNSTLFPETGADETTRHNKAYKLMGVVAHLVGDVYAHRTMVTGTMVNQGIFNKNHFNNWNLFKSEVNAGKVEFRNIATSYTVGKVGSSAYEDNIDVVSSRHDDAKAVVEKLIKDGSAYDFRVHMWNLSVMNHLDTLWKY